jgi:Tfp pilus assembly protein PilE
MNGRSRSTLFLLEQVIVIAVFAVCAAVFASIFADSYLRTQEAWDVNNALIAAKNSAECFKAYENAETAATVLRGSPDALNPESVYYDENWQVCDAETAVYVLRMESEGTARPMLCGLTVSRQEDGKELVALTVAGRGGGAG